MSINWAQANNKKLYFAIAKDTIGSHAAVAGHLAKLAWTGRRKTKKGYRPSPQPRPNWPRKAVGRKATNLRDSHGLTAEQQEKKRDHEERLGMTAEQQEKKKEAVAGHFGQTCAGRPQEESYRPHHSRGVTTEQQGQFGHFGLGRPQAERLPSFATAAA